MDSERGTAMTMAIKVDMMVPKMLLAAPNSPVTGFQFCEIRKLTPKLLDGREGMVQ